MAHFTHGISILYFILLIIVSVLAVTNRSKESLKKKKAKDKIIPLVTAIDYEYYLPKESVSQIFWKNKLQNYILNDLIVRNHIFFTSFSLPGEYSPFIIGIFVFNKVTIYPKNLRIYVIRFIENNIEK